jgi:RNA polymerase sigma factor (sigma-70 family)
MHFSNKYLAEVYCQDDYSPAAHDLYAEAYIRACETYDPQKGDFKKWAGIQRSGIIQQYRRLAKRVRYIEELSCQSLKGSPIAANSESYCSVECDNGTPDSDLFIASPRQLFKNVLMKEQKAIIDDLLSRVSFSERDIIIERYYRDKTKVQTASKLGTSKSTVDRREKKILFFFKEILSKKGITLQDLVA